jgi:hypothetical protein
MKKRIHVNQHHIKANALDGGNRPVFTVKDYRRNRKGNRVVINGPSELVYQPDKPLACGARAWIETAAEVDVHE